MIKLCEIYMIQNGIVISLPPKEDGYIESTAYHTDKEEIDFLWDIAELCGITDKVRITKARKK